MKITYVIFIGLTINAINSKIYVHAQLLLLLLLLLLLEIKMIPVSVKTLVLATLVLNVGVATSDTLKKLHVIELSNSLETPEWAVITDGGTMSRRGKDVYFDLNSKLTSVALELKCGNKAFTTTVKLSDLLTVHMGSCSDVKKM